MGAKAFALYSMTKVTGEADGRDARGTLCCFNTVAVHIGRPPQRDGRYNGRDAIPACGEGLELRKQCE